MVVSYKVSWGENIDYCQLFNNVNIIARFFSKPLAKNGLKLAPAILNPCMFGTNLLLQVPRIIITSSHV